MALFKSLNITLIKKFQIFRAYKKILFSKQAITEGEGESHLNPKLFVEWHSETFQKPCHEYLEFRSFAACLMLHL